MRSITFMPTAWEHLNWWNKENPKMISKIFELAGNAAKTPFEGLGKPEALKGNLQGYWSRRINQEHRIVYKVLPEEIVVMSAKGHY